jgi:hypothetical protein
MIYRLLTIIFLYLVPSLSMASNAVFVVNEVSGSGVKNVVVPPKNGVPTTTGSGSGERNILTGISNLFGDPEVNEEDGTITIPVLQPDGTYENVTITQEQVEEGLNQITIDNGDVVEVIQNSTGTLIQLTPDQIQVSENVTCNVKAETCTIKPFIMVINDRVLSADQMVVGYQEGENLVITQGQATNLRLTGENSETRAGDSVVGVTFGQNERGPSNPIEAVNDVLTLPETFDNQQYMRIDLSTSNLTHSVRNPNNPNEMKDQWGVTDGGVTTSLIIDRSDNLNIHFNGQTTGGIFYDSDPFSDKDVKLNTDAPVSTNIVVTDGDDGTMTTMSILMDGTNSDGSQSTATVVDSRSERRTDTVTANGTTFLNVSSTATYEDGKPQTDGVPVAFELGTERMTVVNDYRAGQLNTTTVEGVRAAGSITPGTDNKELAITGDSIDHTQVKGDEQVQSLGATGGFGAYIYEDDSKLVAQGMTEHAYYNNGGTTVDLSGGIAVRVTDFKEQGEDSNYDGRPVERDAVIVGNQANINYEDSNIKVNDGFALRQIEFADNGSKLSVVEGGDGHLTNDDYGVDLNENFRVVAIQDSKGNVKSAEVTTGEFSGTRNRDGDTLGVIESNTRIDIQQATESRDETMYIRHTSKGIEYRNGNGEVIANVGTAEGQAVIADEVKYGSGTFTDVSFTGEKDTETRKSPTVRFDSVDAALYIDESDPNNRVVEGLFGLQGVEGQHSDFRFNVTAIDENGKEGKFQIYYLENEMGRTIEVYGEDGKRVQFDATDETKGEQYQVLFDAVKYIETDEFRQFLATNVSGTLKPVDSNDNRLTEFNLARVEGMERLDGSFRMFQLEGGHLRHLDGNHEADLRFKNASFVETNTIEASTLLAVAENGNLDFVKYQGNAGTATQGNAEQSVNLSFGQAILQRMELPGGNTTTVFSAQDIHLVAIDYDKMLELDGRIGSVNFFEDAKITAVEAKDLQDFRVEDKDNKITALFNGEKIVRVVERNEAGDEIGSYLLVDSAFLNVKSEELGANANLRIGVFEHFKDELSGKNLYLNVDVSGDVTISSSDIPFDVNASFAVKAKDVYTHQESYVSDDGATVTEHFAIKTFSDEGRIDNIQLDAGPDFLKDAVSLKAKGGSNGGKELSFTFHQDKRQGTYYIRAEFKEGDEIKIKLFPFTLESKKFGNDAVADLLVSPKGQNYMNHLQIITGVIDTHEITSWLEVSDGGMLIASTPTLGGLGVEIMYQDQENFFPAMDPRNQLQGTAKSMGAGLFFESDEGNKTSVGMMLTGDSEIGYQTNGTFKIFGFDMGPNGKIPATVNLYAKREWADGDAIFGGLSYDMTTLMVDESYLDPNSNYYEGGRSPGSLGASLGYKKQLGERSSMTFTVGANEDFSSPAACITFQFRFGGGSSRSIKRFVGNSMNAVRGMGYD